MTAAHWLLGGSCPSKGGRDGCGQPRALLGRDGGTISGMGGPVEPRAWQAQVTEQNHGAEPPSPYPSWWVPDFYSDCPMAHLQGP